ncbi:hypothetical protein [Absidia glauca]|uniref:K Homology domain-containing protein n=1 Tax=Absidia glauca TaxID=4829 RepID=A0A163LWC7_ABSGL|nr:hypothetical protein [Absidia glauca]
MASDDNDNRSNKYAQVPPPPELSSGSTSAGPPVDFSDALQKARAIAEKLKQAGSEGSPSGQAPSSGTKRSYHDDRDDHDLSSSSRHDSSYDSKRSAYDAGSSQPSYSRRSEPHRHGLGSEERQRYQSYGHGDASGSSKASSETIKVPNRMVGVIIGRGGDNLKKIERNSGARVQIDQDDQIQLARDMIQQIVRDSNVGGYDASSYGGDGAESQLTVTVPSHRVGLVIGRGGETIRDLEQRSGAKIKVLPEKSGDHPSERTVAISGNKAATEKAKMMVEDIVNSQPSQAESGARIVVDKYGDQHADEKTLTIHGTPETIAIAKSLISEKVESGQNPRGGDRFGGGGGGYRGGHGGSHGGYGRGGGSYRNDYYGGQEGQQQQSGNGYDYSQQYQNYYGQQQYDGYGNQQSGDQQPYGAGYQGYDYGESQQTQGEGAGKGSVGDGDEAKSDPQQQQQQSDAYYGQYYDQSGAEQPQWTQEAIDQYYQQYYAGQQGGEGYQQPADDQTNDSAADSKQD